MSMPAALFSRTKRLCTLECKATVQPGNKRPLGQQRLAVLLRRRRGRTFLLGLRFGFFRQPALLAPRKNVILKGFDRLLNA
jgi:hypothetical protein